MPPGSAYRNSLSGSSAPVQTQPSVTGGPGSAYRNSVAAQPQQTSKPSGGLFARIVKAAVTNPAHFVAQKSDLAAHDIAAFPGGILKTGTDVFEAEKNLVTKHPAALLPWNAFNPKSKAVKQLKASPASQALNQDVQGAITQTKQSFQHPLRDPFQTALNVAAVATAGAGAVARVADAADAATASQALGRLVGPTAPVKARIIQVPKLVAPEGEGPAALAHEPVQLQASLNPAVRAAQAVHDVVVQRSLDKNASVAEPSAVARYGLGRAAADTNETARVAQRVRAVPTQLLERAGAGRHAFDKGVSQKAGQLALFLKSANITGAEAARFWAGQAVKGENTAGLANLAKQIHEQGLIGTNDAGNVVVNGSRFPKLADVDRQVAENQATREGIIQQHGLMSEEGAQNRLNLVAQKMGVDRQGQGFTSLKTSVKGAPQSPIAVSRGPLIGKVRGFVGGKPAIGSGVAKGILPDNTTAGVARATREALRYVGTVEHRGLVAKYGGNVRASGEDVLVRDPAVHAEGQIPESIDQLLGRKKSTVGTISEAEHLGLAAGFRARLEEAIPGLRDNFAADKAAELGTRAPAGYKWVHEKLLGDLTQQLTPRGKVSKAADTVNSAVTAATVYFKVGHLTTRTFTNAATNILQGSAKPAEIADSLKLWKQLSDREKQEALAATGQHGIQSLPHEGTGKVARIASKGANWWARRIDAPFRFNALAYEARRSGITTPTQFRELLKHAANPTAEGKNAAETAKMDWVLRRSNRASIMYDGLNPTEKRYITRAFWFYPWVKGATRFAFHTASEHPFPTAAGEAAGKLGEQQQANLLGALPSYEYGLIPLGHGANPLTTNFETFTPFGTAGNLAEAVARPGGAAGFLNPVSGAALTAFTGVDQYGNKTTTPLLTALGQAFSPTPESQILNAYLHPAKPTQMFRKTPGSALARALGGPAIPRKVNRTALNKSAARQKTGR